MKNRKHNQATCDQPATAGNPAGRYGCGEYRNEMILASLHRALQNPNLNEQEKTQLKLQVRQLEEAMGL